MFGDIKDHSPITKAAKPMKPKYSKEITMATEATKAISKPCTCCGKENHDLDNCFFFLKKPMSLREAFIKQQKLCFGCLKYTNHRSRDCKCRLVCKKSCKNHPTSLHKAKKATPLVQTTKIVHSERATSFAPEEPCEAQALRSTTETGRVMCPCVPVGIKKKGTNEIIITNMAMDTYATACYIDETLLDELNVKGTPAKLNIKTMESNSSSISVNVVKDLELVSLTDENCKYKIPTVYAKGKWPFSEADSLRYEDIKNYSSLKEIPFQHNARKIGLLVGMNVPEIIKPLEIVHTTVSGPYASKHLFGWAFNGPVTGSSNVTACFRTAISKDYEHLDRQIKEYFALDFDDKFDDATCSRDDQKWLDTVSKQTKRLSNNQFEIPLPFNECNVTMPNNYGYALARLNSLKSQLVSNGKFRQDYHAFMSDMCSKNYVERIPSSELSTDEGKIWFLPHFGVYHKQKKKLRVVFDCAAKYKEVCLNDKLMQGPDLANSLVGVLLRFRAGTIAVTSDIEKMFYSVRIPLTDSNFLRFLWYDAGDINSTPVQFRLRVHVFGAKSSPSCANYALQQCILQNIESPLNKVILDSFYIDDLMLALDSESEAQHLIELAQNVLSDSGFKLTGFVSNSRDLLKTIPCEKLSKSLKPPNLDCHLPESRALGLLWNANCDTFGIQIKIEKKVLTKRNILSILCTIYDPLFIISPAVISAKFIFQQACQLNVGWDEPLPESLQASWEKWLTEIKQLHNFQIPRCYYKSSYSDVELHIFADGSQTAYGCVAYLRFQCNGHSQCSLVMAKVRLVPLKIGSLKTIPRIELNAAKLAVVLYLKLNKELTLGWSNTYFWSDSSIVLSYINSDSTRFQRFVTNRVSFIRTHSSVQQWYHIPGDQNPADVLSRGIKCAKSFANNELWFNGPSFLSLAKNDWPKQSNKDLPHDDPEVINHVKLVHNTDTNPTDDLLCSTSNWFTLKCRVATYLRFEQYLRFSCVCKGSFSATELKNAELKLFKYLQQRYFKDFYDKLVKTGVSPVKHFLCKFSPFIDDDGVMRIGGRLGNSNLSECAKHPIILPKQPLATSLIIEWLHKSLGHLGREALIAHLKLKYHIVGGTSLVKRILNDCVICRRVQGKPCTQFMAELPRERVIGDSPPFSTTGIDYFGPFYVTRGRVKGVKRYGVIFTCLAARACHIEVTHSLDTDSFVNALRRFISRRGPIYKFISDNGTNLVSGKKELQYSINEWNNTQICKFCSQRNIVWEFNPPHASHFGGVYEREIRTIRKVLNSLLNEFGNRVSLTDEVLITLMCEVEDILNSRPLNAVTTDVDDLEAITPNHLLRLNNTCSFPPGVFDKSDLYAKRRWRQIQYMADRFWQRWRKEYLPLLNERQKWYTPKRMIKAGDLVLVVDQLLPRNMWCLGRVLETEVRNSHVRNAKIRVSRCKTGKFLQFGSTVLERPISKLVLLVPNDNP